LVPRAPARVSREVAVREVFYVNRTAAHWVHRGSRRVPFSKHARRCSRLTVHSVRSKTEIILHASLLFRAPSLGSLAIHLSTNGSPALGFPSLFAASPERSYVSSRGIPCPASIRPQVFATSRRFLLLSGLRACFIPQPRSGFFVVQGLLSRRSRPFLIGRRCLLAVAAPPLAGSLRLSPARALVHVRCLSTSRPSSTPGSVHSGLVIHRAQSRSPHRISRSSRSSLTRR
jgi:hypothetical protein